MKHQGFTLVEFIVIISIFAIMAAVALFNFTGFRSSVGLNNLAHDIGLTIRQAQVFGWGNQTQDTNQVIQLEGGTDSGNPIRYAEGVHFTQADPKQFILYRKTSPTAPQYYDTSDIIIDTIKVTGQNSIAGFFKASNKNDLMLVAGNPGPAATAIGGDLSLAFTRPKPEAAIFDGIATIAHPNDYIGIYIKADNDMVFSHVIIVSRMGEIDVQ